MQCFQGFQRIEKIETGRFRPKKTSLKHIKRGKSVVKKSAM